MFNKRLVDCRLVISVAYFLFSFLLPSVSVLAATANHSLPEPVTDEEYRQHSDEKIKLGQLLFFDKELSGNRNISCATCHSPVVATVDGLSVNIGTGGQGLGVLRNAGNFPPTVNDPQSRGIRNMTPLFNLGHQSFATLFWDGRVQVDETIPQGFSTPAGEILPFGFDSPLAALSIFAQTDIQEMTGQPGTNELADASLIAPHEPVWEGIMNRLRVIPEYVDLFTEAFDDIDHDPARMSIVHLGNALGAFQDVAFRADNSPFDRNLRGDSHAMSQNAKRGMRLFYGRAGCSSCHSGVFQTDHDFHAIGVPQVGPGFGDGESGLEDFGRESVTGEMHDRYKFRTPSLRNVFLTGPWGHDGFFNSLELMIRHHLDPLNSLFNADPTQLVLPSRPDLDAVDLLAFNNNEITAAIAQAIEIETLKNISDKNIKYLLDFLQALTDPSAQDLRKSVPNRVPTDLPLAEIR